MEFQVFVPLISLPVAYNLVSSEQGSVVTQGYPMYLLL